MKLQIRHIGKIKEASFSLNGLTVITGLNNTGKSTVGKALCGFFNALKDIDTACMDEIKSKIQRNSEVEFQNFILREEKNSDFKINESISFPFYLRLRSFWDKDRIEYDQHGITEYIREICGGKDKEDSLEISKKLIHMVETSVVNHKKIFLNDDMKNRIKKEIITRFFHGLFHDQPCSLLDQEEAEVGACINHKTYQILFQNHDCIQYSAEDMIQHKAVYIDDPFDIDNVDYQVPSWQAFPFRRRDDLLGHFSDVFIRTEKEPDLAQISLNKKNYERIKEQLDKVLCGDISKKKDGLYVTDQSLREPMHVSNLSTGKKTFSMIKMLFERGILQENDVLVLDEPEIHLHPEWQVIYAEMIVIMQKLFDLTIVITTHSPYFLYALQIFSSRHDIMERTNYYFASEGEDRYAYFEDVTDHLDKVYRIMYEPLQRLENLRAQENEKQ